METTTSERRRLKAFLRNNKGTHHFVTPCVNVPRKDIILTHHLVVAITQYITYFVEASTSGIILSNFDNLQASPRRILHPQINLQICVSIADQNISNSSTNPTSTTNKIVTCNHLKTPQLRFTTGVNTCAHHVLFPLGFVQHRLTSGL